MAWGRKEGYSENIAVRLNYESPKEDALLLGLREDDFNSERGVEKEIYT